MPRAKGQSIRHVDTVTITIQGDSLVEVSLDALEIDNHLRQLGELRARMNPQHSSSFDGSEKISTVFNPSLICEAERILAHRVLRIRDPRYGWLHYTIPRDIAEKLAEALRAADARQPAEGISH
jgi:hypothetical protein